MIHLDDIKKPLKFKISYNLCRDDIKDTCLNVYNDELDFDVFLPSIDKNLQRPFVWNLQQKQQLVYSVFKNTYIPPISIIQFKEKTGNSQVKIEVIDGKQRLSTLIDFYNNKFVINVKNQDYYFKDLPKDLQDLYGRYSPLYNVAYSYSFDTISDQSKIDWFEMINFAGTAQDIEHLNSLKK